MNQNDFLKILLMLQMEYPYDIMGLFWNKQSLNKAPRRWNILIVDPINRRMQTTYSNLMFGHAIR
jgi:hypothetical protein